MIGRKLKNYQIEELLGEGGMGVVYRARDLNLDRMVAIKMLHPEMLHQPDLLKRFRNEAHVTARLAHPNIATLFNFFSEENLHCLVMEYVNGRTLEQILETHKQLPEKECVKILIQLLEGLGEAHHNGILHRDIKPGNIMINRSGYVKLMDFGVARFENSARITRMNRVIGTLEYMAPELLTGSKPSVAADIYSVGIVAYEMYSGRLPFEAEADTDIIELILKGKISFAARAASAVGRNSKLESVISRMMHKSQNRRFKSAGEAIAELEKLTHAGRVSTALLSKQKLISDPGPRASKSFMPTGFNLDEYADGVKSLYQTYSSNVSEFLKTAEGKIIGGAVAIAAVILLLAGLFSGSQERSASEQTAETRPAETALLEAVNQNRTDGIIAPDRPSVDENALQTPSSRNQASTEEDHSAPPPVVVNPGRDNRSSITQPERRESTVESRAGSGSGQSTVSQAPADRGQTESKKEKEEIAEESVNRQDTIERVEEEVAETFTTEDTIEERIPTRTIEVNAANAIVSAQFADNISTRTHSTGDSFYLITTGDVYSDGIKIIDAGARVRGKVQNATAGDGTRRGRAFLAVTFEEVQAIDGSWLPINYPEYSDRGGDVVTFARGTTLNRLRIASGIVTLEFE